MDPSGQFSYDNVHTTPRTLGEAGHWFPGLAIRYSYEGLGVFLFECPKIAIVGSRLWLAHPNRVVVLTDGPPPVPYIVPQPHEDADELVDVLQNFLAESSEDEQESVSDWSSAASTCSSCASSATTDASGASGSANATSRWRRQRAAKKAGMKKINEDKEDDDDDA